MCVMRLIVQTTSSWFQTSNKSFKQSSYFHQISDLEGELENNQLSGSLIIIFPGWMIWAGHLTENGFTISLLLASGCASDDSTWVCFGCISIHEIENTYWYHIDYQCCNLICHHHFIQTLTLCLIHLYQVGWWVEFTSSLWSFYQELVKFLPVACEVFTSSL